MGKEDDSWLDTQFSQCDASNPSHISMLFGREFLTVKIYQLCPPEVINLLRITFIVRPIVLCQIVSYGPISRQRHHANHVKLYHYYYFYYYYSHVRIN